MGLGGIVFEAGSARRSGAKHSAFNVYRKKNKDIDHQRDAEKERRNRCGLKAENPFWVKYHVAVASP
jgi:hypothetical protein